MDLKKLMSGANPQSVMLEQTRGLKAKWEKTGLLEGVNAHFRLLQLEQLQPLLGQDSEAK